MSSQTIKILYADFTNVIKVDDVNNSDGKASLKRQKSPKNKTDTQGMSKFY